jgi:CRP-like cAMP-binding protein
MSILRSSGIRESVRQAIDTATITPEMRTELLVPNPTVEKLRQIREGLRANRLLAKLSENHRELLVLHLARARFAKGDVLYQPGDRIHSIYFPTSGMISLVYGTKDGTAIAVDTVGKGGMIGVPLVLGVGISAYRAVVEAPSEALVIRAAAFKLALKQPELKELLLRYAHELLVQVSQAAVCYHDHTVEQRLCTHLLTVKDCLGSDKFQLTHELLSYLLAAGRPTVTQAARAIHDKGLIRYRWGSIEILDRRRLEAGACECYRREFRLCV